MTYFWAQTVQKAFSRKSFLSMTKQTEEHHKGVIKKRFISVLIHASNEAIG